MSYRILLIVLSLFGMVKSVDRDAHETPFVIIIPSFRNAPFYEENLNSIYNQKKFDDTPYQNFRVLYIADNDYSPESDGTGTLVEQYIKKNHVEEKTKLIRNKTRQLAVGNLYKAVLSCRDDEVAVFVDGDDAFAHDYVLARLNHVYSNKEREIWFTYGNFYCSSHQNLNCPWSAQVPNHVIHTNSLRTWENFPTHLRTCKTWVFKQLEIKDLFYEGAIFKMAYDIALFIPVLEMSAYHFEYIDDILYKYNDRNPLSDSHVNWVLQKTLDNYVRAKSPYQPLSASRCGEIDGLKLKGKLKADLVIYSHDPIRLRKLLASLDGNGVQQIYIIYTPSTATSDYDVIAQEFPSCIIGSLSDLFAQCLNDTTCDYLLITDDTQPMSSLPITDSLYWLESTHAHCFYFNLNKHIFDQSLFSGSKPKSSLQITLEGDQNTSVHSWQYQSTMEHECVSLFNRLLGRKKDFHFLIPYSNDMQLMKDAWTRYKNSEHVGLFYYQSPQSAPHIAASEFGSHMIIFSYDRPLLLHALLESLSFYAQGIEQISVLYRTSDPIQEQAYQQCFATFAHVLPLEVIKQGKAPRDDFKPLLMKILQDSIWNYIIFAVDDLIAKDFINLTECAQALEQTGAYGFHLRLGKNITESYTRKAASPIPSHQDVSGTMFKWRFDDGLWEWCCPHTLDMTLYKKSDTQTIQYLSFTSPNTLEAAWGDYARDHGYYQKSGIAFGKSKTLNIPLNLVQEDFTFASHMGYDSQELLDKYSDGWRINILKYQRFDNHTPHVELHPHLTRPSVMTRLTDQPDDVLNFAKDYLPTNPIIVEAGGYNGDDTIKMSALWPKGHIHVFEPIPALFKIIQEKVSALPNVTPYQLALSDKKGMAIFYVSELSWNPDFPSASSSLLPPLEHLNYIDAVSFKKTIEVLTITLAEWAHTHSVDHIDFLWLDMQGYELNMLKHAEELLNRVSVIYTEVEFVEAYKGQYLFHDIKKWLESRGFSLIATDFDIGCPTCGGRLPWGNALFKRTGHVRYKP